MGICARCPVMFRAADCASGLRNTARLRFSLKFRSSMTLFASVAPDNQVFKDALEKYFGGEADRLTRTAGLMASDSRNKTPIFI